MIGAAKHKYLPFSKVAATKDFEGFYVCSRSLPFVIGRVLRFCPTIGHKFCGQFSIAARLIAYL